MTVEVLSLGCRLNIAESERMRRMLAGSDDLIVVNSCAVTAEAVRHTRQAIRRARRTRPDARLIVTGCAAEVERNAIARLPEVDGLVANADKLDPRAWNAPATPPPMAGERRRHSRGFVQVQNGCDFACTFCIIPRGRGPSRSRPLAAVLDDVASHLAAGAREIVLTGVDLASWGGDLPDAPRLGALVGGILAAFPQLDRLRLSSLDGAALDDELAALIAGEARLMPHLHLSLQSGDDLILKRMKRRHSRGDAIALVDRLRRDRPDLAIGADLIAGFPTEDDAMHRNSLAIVDALDIVHGHVFPYSSRPGTPAARMPQVAPAIAKTRAAELRAAIAARRDAWLGRMVGRPLTVLAESDGTGHAENFAPVRLAARTAAGALLTVVPDRIVAGALA